MEAEQDPEQKWIDRARWWIITGLQVALAAGALLQVLESRWFAAAITGAIIATTFLPHFIGRHWGIRLVPEFEFMALLFVLASIFLGEVQGYYTRFWWWDLALHSTSGLLLGIFGFLLVYLLNENERIHLHMRPRFVALFAFMFSVAIGAIWEIFEFSMDQLAGANMQKPMFNDPSGLTDTMWDLIVDTLGAGIIAIIGWLYMRRGRRSFFESWIARFIDRNPQLFKSDADTNGGGK